MSRSSVSSLVLSLVLSPGIAALCVVSPCCGQDTAEIPRQLQAWLAPQDWQRDTPGAVISLGEPGDFDDTHIFAPLVALENDQYRLWYCGSQGAVARRVFQLGMATSDDGKQFLKHSANPVFRFDDGKHSVLTPTLLRARMARSCARGAS